MHTKLYHNIYHSSSKQIFRLIIGNEIEPVHSKIFIPSKFANKLSPVPFSSEFELTTGSIGYCDFYFDVREIPAVDFDTTKKVVECPVICILFVGVEPEHRNKGYANTLLNLAKEYAISQGCKAVWHDLVEDELLANKYRRTGLRQIGENFIEYLV